MQKKGIFYFALSNPKTIAKSLQSELDVTSVIKDELDASSASLINLGNESSSYSIRAGHFSAGYAVISWLMTSIVIFVFYHENFAPLSILYPYLMGFAVGGLVLTRNLSAYSYNKHLQNNIKPNFHTSIVPIIYIIGGFSKLYLLPVSALWTTPASLVLFLILGSTEYGRKFYSNKIMRCHSKF